MVVVVYGDATRREQFVLPKSLGDLQRKCEQLFGFRCTLYIDLGKVGQTAKNSWSTRVIRNESDFCFIKDWDVVICVDPHGRRLDPRALFDGLTTYRRDYVAHPLRPKRLLPEQDWSADALPDLSKLMYRTTYGQHYTPKEGERKDTAAYDGSFPPRRTSPTGISIYQQDYVPQGLEPRDPYGDETRNIAKPFQDYRTTYSRDYTPKEGERILPEGASYPHQDLLPAPPWRPTEYVEEYVPKSAKPTNMGDGDWVPDYGPGAQAVPWDSSHRRDYVAYPYNPTDIYADPELDDDDAINEMTTTKPSPLRADAGFGSFAAETKGAE